MFDTKLDDDMLKLVRYRVLFVKRDYEVAFEETEELVEDNMSATDFAAWKVAEFVQKLDRVRVPESWAQKGFPNGSEERDGRRYVMKLDEEDRKYLRVHFEVLERYPREKVQYEERQVDVLKQIRDGLKE